MDLRRIVLYLLKGREQELPHISYLLTSGMLSGMAITFYLATMTTLFLENEEFRRSDFALGFISSGITATTFITIYNYFQKRKNYALLATISYFFIFLLLFTTTTLVFYYPNHTTIILGYILLPPIMALTNQVFWGSFGRMFNFQAAKRLAGGIDMGQVLAMLTAFITILLIEKSLDDISVLLFIALFFAFLNFINSLRLHFGHLRVNTRVQKENDLNPSSRVKRKYIVTLSLFLVISVFCASFVETSYKMALEQKYSNEQDLLYFVSFISIIVITSSFLVQTVINDWLLENYGIRFSVLILPLILFILTSINTIIILLYGVSLTDSMGIFIFIFVVMSQVLVSSLRDALESPLFKIFFFPIHESERFSIQAIVEGNIKEVGTVAAGLSLLFLDRLFPETNTTGYLFNNAFLFTGAVFWFVFGILSYKGYKQLLNNNLKYSRVLAVPTDFKTRVDELLSYQMIEIQNQKEKQNLLYFLFYLHPVLFIRKFHSIQLSSPSLSSFELKTYLKIIEGFISADLIHQLESIRPQRYQLIEQIGMILLDYKKSQEESFQTIDQWSSSYEFCTRLKALRYIYQSYQPDYAPFLFSMLQDYNDIV